MQKATTRGWAIGGEERCVRGRGRGVAAGSGVALGVTHAETSTDARLCGRFGSKKPVFTGRTVCGMPGSRDTCRSPHSLPLFLLFAECAVQIEEEVP